MRHMDLESYMRRILLKKESSAHWSHYVYSFPGLGMHVRGQQNYIM